MINKKESEIHMIKVNFQKNQQQINKCDKCEEVFKNYGDTKRHIRFHKLLMRKRRVRTDSITASPVNLKPAHYFLCNLMRPIVNLPSLKVHFCKITSGIGSYIRNHKKIYHIANRSPKWLLMILHYVSGSAFHCCTILKFKVNP